MGEVAGTIRDTQGNAIPGGAAPPESAEALIAALPQIDWNWSAAP